MSEEFSEVAKSEGTQPQEGFQGNGLERLKILSGLVIIIDQFMLGNDQFFTKLKGLCGDLSDVSSRREQIAEAVQAFGGCLLEAPCGDYAVLRDPEKAVMLLYPTTIQGEAAPTAPTIGGALASKREAVNQGGVFVDTRCLVFVDASILTDKEFLANYQGLRKAGHDKKARDLIREWGGAVRYGFQKYGDELGAFTMPSLPGVFALWPDVVEPGGVA